MSRFDFRRLITRRKLESAGVVLVAVAGAVGVASQGQIMENTPQHAVAEMVGREVANTQVAARLAGEPAKQVADAGVQWDIPNLDHQQVDKWIARFQGNMKSSLQVYMNRMDRYDDMIAQKAEAKGLPKDLVYLAMIESGGNATAKSPVAARGLWQFMSPTAREYGLKVGRTDERIDPVKSTDAALEYLNDLYKRFGSWYLAAAAYNTGQGRVARIMKQETGRTKGTDADYYRISRRLPQETRDYVPKMIAAARIAKEPAKYGFATSGD